VPGSRLRTRADSWPSTSCRVGPVLMPGAAQPSLNTMARASPTPKATPAGPTSRRSGEHSPGGPHPAPCGGHLADTPGVGWEGPAHGPPGGRAGPPRPGDGLPVWPPGPDDQDAWARVVDAGGPQPSVRRMADGLAHRVDRLHAIGNGVVPLVAAHAFIGLARRAGLLADEQGSSPPT